MVRVSGLRWLAILALPGTALLGSGVPESVEYRKADTSIAEEVAAVQARKVLQFQGLARAAA